jgi:hypothetical protein
LFNLSTLSFLLHYRTREKKITTEKNNDTEILTGAFGWISMVTFCAVVSGLNAMFAMRRTLVMAIGTEPPDRAVTEAFPFIRALSLTELTTPTKWSSPASRA